MTQRRGGLLCGLVASVLLLHGWLLDALAGWAPRRAATDAQPPAVASAPQAAAPAGSAPRRLSVLAVTLAVGAAAPALAQPLEMPAPLQLAQAAPAVAPAPSPPPPRAVPRAAAGAASAAAPRRAPRPVRAAPPRAEPASASASEAPPAAGDASAPPTYRTRIPPAARVNYRLSRGATGGPRTVPTRCGWRAGCRWSAR